MAREREVSSFKGFNFLRGMFGLDCRHLLCHQELHSTGFGQEMATEKSKILAKCLSSSNPSLALQMLSDCGMNVTREPLVIGSSPSVDMRRQESSIGYPRNFLLEILGISSLQSDLPQLQRLAFENWLDGPRLEKGGFADLDLPMRLKQRG